MPKQNKELEKQLKPVIQNEYINDTPTDDLGKMFESELAGENDILKELFSEEHIKVKTDLTKNEVSIISRLQLQSDMTKDIFLSRVLNEFETLRVSKDRLSRQEFVKAFQANDEDKKKDGFLGSLGNIISKDK